MQPFLETKALVDELSGSDGGPFQRFMTALVGVEAATHGIQAKDIQSDHRINVGDHGIDLEITVAHGQPKPRFVPAVKSIWSFKAGDDGVNPAKFEKEVTAQNHQPLQDRLGAGYAFVWCALQPITSEKRSQFVKKADDLAKKYGWKPEQFEFRWVNANHDLAELYPNLLAHHVPKAWSAIGNLKSIDKWEPQGTDRAGYSTKWVSIAGRDGQVDAIQAHLRSTGGGGVLHIAGLSGVGKTRLVHHACKVGGLGDTFYLPHYELLTDKLVDLLRERNGHTRLVIDEVKLQHVNDVFDKVGPLGRHLRVITIGPATRRDSRGSSKSVIYLAEPESSTDTVTVVKAFSTQLADAVIQFIAEKSRHDLRFALLLAKALQKDDAVPRKPGEIWKRVLSLFEDVPHRAELESQYGFLATAIDINCTDNEVKAIADCYNTQETALRSAIKAADDVGLGITTPNYFEACPRGLAAFIFEEYALQLLIPKIAEFFKTCPDRLRRRVVERCHEIEDNDRREEVVERIATYFREELGKPVLVNITDRGTSRLFQKWAELDPDRGLAWLKVAVDAASNEDLAKFDGQPDGSGGWRGRRQIVWLLEHLSCFAEYFPRCEAILFRLAQVETEKSISNNSRSIWLQMFDPMPLSIETPFLERWNLLKTRILSAKAENVALAFEAAKRLTDHHQMIWMAPPPIVGGRIVPRPWMPKSWSELGEMQRTYALELLGILETVAEKHGALVRAFLIERVFRYTEFGLLDQYRKTIERLGLSEPEWRTLRSSLDNILQVETWRRKDKPEWKERLSFVEGWLNDSQPRALPERIKELTGRSFWSTSRMVTEKDKKELTIPYKRLAGEILANIAVLEDLAEWLSSRECQSGQNLGEELGIADKEGAACDLMLRWLEARTAQPLVLGYFLRRQESESARAAVVKVLDTLAGTYPTDAFTATVTLDQAPTGVERVLRLSRFVDVPRLRLFGCLAHEPWKNLLSGKQKAEVLETLLGHADQGAREVLRTAMHLEWLWSSPGKKEQTLEFVPQIRRTLQCEAKGEPFHDAHEWDELVKLVAVQHTDEAARLLVDTLTAFEDRSFERADAAQSLLIELAGANPDAVANAIFAALKDPKRGIMFHVFEFRNLFDAIDLSALKPRVETADEDTIAAIARHIKSPYIENDLPVIPELTNWLLTTYGASEKVLQPFLIGRHSGEWKEGHARERAASQLAMLRRFEGRAEPWIKRWIQYERDAIEADIKMDDRHEEHLDRE